MPPIRRPDAVSRTVVGDHEIAVPSLGLSLTQRRLLTLLDTPTPAATLAERSGLPPEKLVRDLGRLARFRLIEGTLPEATAPDGGGPVTLSPTIGRVASPVAITPAANAPWTPNRGSRPRGAVWTLGVSAVVVAAAVAAYLWHTAGPAPLADSQPAPSSPYVRRPASTSQQTAMTPTPQPAAVNPAAARSAANPGKPGATAGAARSTIAREIAALHALEAQAIAGGPAPPRGIDRSGSGASSESTPAAIEPAASDTAGPRARPFEPDAPAPNETSAKNDRRATSDPPARLELLAKLEPLATSEPLAKLEPPATPEPAATTARATPASIAALTPIARVAPEFPGEAIRRHVDAGSVRARVNVDAAGHVIAVAVVSASPRGVFDDAVAAALAKWRFPPGAAGRSTIVDVEFRRD